MTTLYLLNRLKNHITSPRIRITYSDLSSGLIFKFFKAKLNPNPSKYTRIQAMLLIRESSSEVCEIKVYKRDGSFLNITKKFDSFMNKNYKNRHPKSKKCYNHYKLNNLTPISSIDEVKPITLIDEIQRMFDNLINNVFGDKLRYRQESEITELNKKYLIINTKTNNVDYRLELVFKNPNHCINFKIVEYKHMGTQIEDLFPHIMCEDEGNPYFLAIQRLDTIGLFKLMFNDIDLTNECVSNVLALIKLKLTINILSTKNNSVESIDEKLINLVTNLSSEAKSQLLKDLT